MKTNTISPDDGRDPTNPSPTALFRAFSAARRQHTVQYLVQKPGAVLLGDIAEYIAVVEGEPTRDRYERVLVSLHHVHVPQLIDADVVRYDAECETLELTTDSDTVHPYLRLAAGAPTK